MNDELGSLINTLAILGPDDEAAQAILQRMVEILRSGEDVPASAAKLLADLIDPEGRRFPYQLRLTENRKIKRLFDKLADTIDCGLEVERRKSGDDRGVTATITIITTEKMNELPEDARDVLRTIWRRWAEYKKLYPDGCPPDDKLMFEWARQITKT